MEKHSVDKRVIKTKNAIRNAFYDLVQTKDMMDISVSELTEAAHITRSTFYMYYDSVAAVRDQIENDIISHLDNIMNGQDWLECMVNPYPLLDAIGKEITKYDEFNHYILCGNHSGRLFEKVNQRVVEAFTKYVHDNRLDIDVSRAKYIAAFIAAGIGECFKIWFNHKSSLTLEELCMRISEYVTKGVKVLRDIEM